MAEQLLKIGTGRCGLAVDTTDPNLPVAGMGRLSRVRKSRRARWRAAVLIAVHLLIAAHIAHFIASKRTLSPVEPSEAMYTIELGQLNAGFIFFAVALLGTLVFGRFFCGWGCHLVALQDLCGWIMKKVGIRPRPFRSRLLALAPILLAIYMFVWPTAYRLIAGGPDSAFAGFSNHLMTTGFWQTFPGPLFAVLTFVTCGFAAVYFLGSKGFCTYGCPYGAFFAAADYASPGRIVVNDGCEQCGHCTATCTSNVRVHEEVKLYGMVVDSGCMKCMDCVNVCPKGALSFSFSAPSLFKRRAATRRMPRYDLGLVEELAVAGVCVAAVLAFRGLYDGPPLLMSVALGGISAFASLKLWHLFRRPDVRLQNLRLKSAGRVPGAGRAFAAAAAVWLLFTAHSGAVQWQRAWGNHYLQATSASREEVLSGAFRERRYPESHRIAEFKAFRHLSRADRWGIGSFVDVKLGLAWSHLLRDEEEEALRHIRAAIDLDPDDPALHQNLVDLLVARGRLPEGAEALRRKIDSSSEPAQSDRFALAGLMAETGRQQEAADLFAQCVAATPDWFEARFNYGGLLRRVGRNDEAIEQLSAARSLLPQDADAPIELGLAYMAAGRDRDALEAFRNAVALAPDSPESRLHLPALIRRLEEQGGGGVSRLREEAAGVAPERGG